jgi:hypothetical protein
MRNVTRLGIASLGFAVLGVLLPVLLIAVGNSSSATVTRGGPTFLGYILLGLSVLLYLGLEVLALTCGVAARRTKAGATGMILSGLLLFSTLALILIGLGLTVDAKVL